MVMFYGRVLQVGFHLFCQLTGTYLFTRVWSIHFGMVLAIVPYQEPISLSVQQYTLSNKSSLQSNPPCPLPSISRRNRALQPGDSPYDVDPGSVVIGEMGCQLDVINRKTGVVLGADITSLEGNMYRVRINEKNPMRQRYEVEGVLVGEPKTER